MKKLLCAALLMLLAVTARAEESASVEMNGLRFTISDCFVAAWEAGPFEDKPEAVDTRIGFDWTVEYTGDPSEMECFLFDFGEIAVPDGAGEGRFWEPGYGMEPMNPGLVMGMMDPREAVTKAGDSALFGIAYDRWTWNFPVECVFRVDFYETVVKTSSLSLVNEVWRMKRYGDTTAIAEPDVPDMNGGSTIPKVLQDYLARVQMGHSQEEQLKYQSDWQLLRRMFVKIWKLAKPIASYEVRLTFSELGVPGHVEITEIK